MKRYTLLLLVITGLTLLSPSLHGEEKSAVNESVKKSPERGRKAVRSASKGK